MYLYHATFLPAYGGLSVLRQASWGRYFAIGCSLSEATEEEKRKNSRSRKNIK
jgi:hypothetical protein